MVDAKHYLKRPLEGIIRIYSAGPGSDTIQYCVFFSFSSAAVAYDAVCRVS